MSSLFKTNLKRWVCAMSLAALPVMILGCSDDDEEQTTSDMATTADTVSPQNDQGVDGTSTEAEQGVADLAVDVPAGTKTATDVQLGLHNNNVKIVLSTMEVFGEQEEEYDLYMAHDAVDNGPNLKLGPGVTAVNLGSDTDYHAVTEAPASGYEADDDTNMDWVIGNSWRSGGEGSTGFIMSENVYVLKLADGTYAKIEVLSAKSGAVHVLCYHQPSGTRDITTEE